MLAEIFEHFAVKLSFVVHYEFPWYSEAAYDLLLEKLLDCLRGYCGQLFRFYPFGEVLDGDRRVAEVSRGGW